MGMDALPSPTNLRIRRVLSLCLTGPVWKDMMSACQDIYNSTTWLVVKLLIVVPILEISETAGGEGMFLSLLNQKK